MFTSFKTLGWIIPPPKASTQPEYLQKLQPFLLHAIQLMYPSRLGSVKGKKWEANFIFVNSPKNFLTK